MPMSYSSNAVSVASTSVQESKKPFKNRRYAGLRYENGVWIQWIPSPALAKWKTSPTPLVEVPSISAYTIE
ncbi:MAG: hypothetical protein HEQ32_03840 [Vampirovibrio sp.]